MADLELIRVRLGDDTTDFVVSELRRAARSAELFDPAPCVHVASTERHARDVSVRVGESYPQGTPDRVARELIRRFAPEVSFRSPVERDFDFFGALTETLRDLGENRRAGRALVDELLRAFKRLAQTIPPAQRGKDALSEWLPTLGPRGKLFGGVVRRYLKRLDETSRHDPEDALWIASERIKSWGMAPALVVIDDIDHITPAREALLRALAKAGRRTVMLARGIRGVGDELEFTARSHELVQEIVQELGGRVIDEREDWPARPFADVCRDWIDDATIKAPGISLLRPPTRAAEVNEAARAIKRAFHDGVKLSEICVTMPSTGNYRELIEETFTGAGIPFDAPFEIPLDETPVVASLLDLVRAAIRELPRNDVIDALGSPFLPFDAPDDAGRDRLLRLLDEVTREGWVVGGRDVGKDWIAKLDAKEHKAWPGIRKPVQAILALLHPFTHGRQRAVDFFNAMETLVARSGAARVAGADRKRGDPGAGLREGALHSFRNLLRDMRDEFKRMGNPSMPTGELLRAFTEQAATRSVRPPETRGERVRVLGLRELRGVRYRRVIVLGLTDQDLPLAEEELMFLPGPREDDLKRILGERRARELCAPIDVTAQADYLFAHTLLASDEALTLSLPAADGDTPFVPATPLARFLRGAGVMEIDKLPEHAAGDPPASGTELGSRAAVGLSRIERGDAEAVSALSLEGTGLEVGLGGRRIELARTDMGSPPGGYEGLVGANETLGARFATSGAERHTFSPSQIDTYAECPMRFWARYIIRAKAPEDPTLDTRPHAIGTLLHAALEHWVLLLRRKAGQDDVLANPVEREAVSLLEIGGDHETARRLGLELMIEAFDYACEHNPTEGPFWEGVKKLVGAGLPGREVEGLGTGLLARFVEHELGRNAEGCAIRFVEFDFGKDNDPEAHRPDTLPDVLEIELPDGTLRLMGSVDRVDESPDGLQIIDYKTGNTKTTSEVRDGKSFQLPAYLAAISQLAEKTPDGMMYLQVKPEGAIKPVDVTTFRRKRAFDVNELVFTRLPARLSRMLNALREGVFIHLPFDKNGKPCTWCDYAGSCARRMDVINERQRRLQAEDQGEIPHAYLPDKEPAK